MRNDTSTSSVSKDTGFKMKFDAVNIPVSVWAQNIKMNIHQKYGLHFVRPFFYFYFLHGLEVVCFNSALRILHCEKNIVFLHCEKNIVFHVCVCRWAIGIKVA